MHKVSSAPSRSAAARSRVITTAERVNFDVSTANCSDVNDRRTIGLPANEDGNYSAVSNELSFFSIRRDGNLRFNSPLNATNFSFARNE